MPAYHTFRPPHVLSTGLHEFLRTEAGCDFKSLTGLFPAEWKAVVMGGRLRDLLLDHILESRAKPADVDIVIFGANSIDEIKRKLGTATCSTNAFGGVKCQLRPGGMVFDIWRVEDHTNMTKASKPHTIEQLLRHNLLDVDAILWEPEIDRLHDYGCMKAIETERIGLMGPDGISQEFLIAQLVHVLAIAFKTGFALSDDVRSFVTNASARCRPADIIAALERRLPQAATQIELLLNDLLSGGTQRCPASTRAVNL
jgi:hypothetical protein